MRQILAVLLVCALTASGAAQAGVRVHMPQKKHHHRHGDARTTPDAPTSDIPEPVWSQPRT